MRYILSEGKNIFRIILGIFAASFGLKGFLLSSKFIDGGVTGVSMLLANVTDFPLSIMLIVFNLPFIFLGYKQIGKKFAVKSTLAIIGLSICMATVKFPDVTADLLLTSVFGGVFIGAGIGLAMRGGAVLDGTEIAALIITRNTHILKVGDVILLLNIVIFSVAAFFLGIDIALYSVLTYIAASKTIDFIIHGIEEHTAVIIISDKSNEIRSTIINDLKRGVTIYKGRKGFSGADQEILFCVVTRLEIGNIKTAAIKIDPSAFIVVHALHDVDGGIVKKFKVH